MKENISTVDFTQLNDKIENNAISLIYKKIKEITITDTRIRDAFKLFVSNVETDGCISIADIIYTANELLRKNEIDINSGNIVFSYKGVTSESKLLKNSVFSLFELLYLHNGVSLDIDAIGGSISSAELNNYLVVAPKKTDKFIKIANKAGIDLIKAGCILSENKVVITCKDEIIETYDKSSIVNGFEPVNVTLGSEHFDAFSEGYSSVLSYVLCNCINENSVISYGITDDFPKMLSRAIGYFAATLKTKSMKNKIKFRADEKLFTAAPRPNVIDGDYYYLLKLRNDYMGLPDYGHFNQLLMYLTEFKKRGIIKNVLPYKENIESTLKRICPENLEYDTITKFSDKCFGVVVSVGRGDSLNGIKLGYFKSV